MYSVSEATVTTHLDTMLASPSNSLEEVRVLTADVRFSRSRNLIESPVTCAIKEHQCLSEETIATRLTDRDTNVVPEDSE